MIDSPVDRGSPLCNRAASRPKHFIDSYRPIGLEPSGGFRTPPLSPTVPISVHSTYGRPATPTLSVPIAPEPPLSSPLVRRLPAGTSTSGIAYALCGTYQPFIAFPLRVPCESSLSTGSALTHTYRRLLPYHWTISPLCIVGCTVVEATVFFFASRNLLVESAGLPEWSVQLKPTKTRISDHPNRPIEPHRPHMSQGGSPPAIKRGCLCRVHVV